MERPVTEWDCGHKERKPDDPSFTRCPACRDMVRLSPVSRGMLYGNSGASASSGRGDWAVS